MLFWSHCINQPRSKRNDRYVHRRNDKDTLIKLLRKAGKGSQNKAQSTNELSIDV
jgi:hypothetical protein